jgi:hypothetical protein
MYTPHSEETMRRWPDLYKGPAPTPSSSNAQG